MPGGARKMIWRGSLANASMTFVKNFSDWWKPIVPRETKTRR